MAPRLPVLKKKDSTPTRQVTGTSYSAAPAVKPPSYLEVGSATDSQIREIVPELATRRLATQTYAKMSRSDASVKSSLRIGKSPVLGGDYYVDPFDASEENQSIAEFINFNIFHAMTTPWLVTLQEICHFFEDAFAVMEPVYELREWAPKKNNPLANRRKYTMLRKLAPRPALTIQKFNYDDNGGPVEIVQNAIDKDGKVKEVKIPIEKAIVFTFDKRGGNLEGESVLRSAYPHWFYKTILYNIDAIQKERHGIGVPDIKLLPGFTKADKKVAHELGRNLRTNESAYIVRTANMEVGFAEIKTQPANALESAQHHDNQIMKNMLVQFINLGIEGQGGGRATGATAADIFLKSSRYIANTICEYFNQYLIPNLVAYNFDTDQFPKMKVRNIGETKDIQMWASAIGNLIKEGAITMDLPTEQFLRDIVDFPTKLEERPELTEQQIKENILLQGNVDGSKQTPEDQKGLPAPKPGGNNGGPGETSGNVGKSPTSGAV